MTQEPILLCGLLLVAATGVASAAGLSLHWNNCTAAGGVQNQNFACNDDLTTFSATGQFRMPSALTGVTGAEFTIEMATAGAALPAWWRVNAGECRDGHLNLDGLAAGKVGCPDWSGGKAQGGLAAYNEAVFGNNTAHILGGFAVRSIDARNLTDLTQSYFAFNLVVFSEHRRAFAQRS